MSAKPKAPKAYKSCGAMVLECVTGELRKGNCHVPVGAWDEAGIIALEAAAKFLRRSAVLPSPSSKLARLEREIFRELRVLYWNRYLFKNKSILRDVCAGDSLKATWWKYELARREARRER